MPYYTSCKSDKNERRQDHRIFCQIAVIVDEDHHNNKNHIG
jgi:hypothetical protein